MARRTRAIAAAIPGARVYRIGGPAHAAPFDAPEEFVRMITTTPSRLTTVSR
jgi:pimeloyl-ACP methyl ester carboxylesterase